MNYKNKFSVAILLFFAAITLANAQETLATSPFSIRVFGTPLITNITSDKYAAEEKTAFGYNFGGDLVYTFYQGKKVSLNASLGLGLTNYNALRQTDFKNEHWTSEYESTISANQTFYLTETATNINEKQKMMFLDIPVKLGIDYAFTPKLSAYATVGLAYGVSLSAKYNSTASITRTGFYPDYNALLFDVDVPGSPYFYPTNKAVTGSGNIAQQANFSAEGALGAKYKITPTIALFAGAKLMHGLQNVKTSPAEFIMATSATAMNTLANRADELQTRGLGLEIGVQFGLNKKVKPAPVKEVPAVVIPVKKDTIIPVVKKDTVVKPVVKKVEIEGVELTCKVVEAVTLLPVKATLLIKNNGETIKTVQTDNNGLIKVVIPEGKIYTAEVSAAGYVPQSQTVDFTNVPRGMKKEIVLDPIQKIAKGLIFKFKNVNFNTGTPDLTPESLEILDMVAGILIENPKLQIEISGHTDNQGNAAYNLRLSNHRANAVMKYLLSKGAKPEQMKALGFGQTKWITSNTTDEGRAENRRVEFKVLGM
jgi:outer membrane protein OmpA-like peptidoglycan-associated protein